jgi:NADPH:quinone reductase-like Zn-dependent oxidoreductase
VLVRVHATSVNPHDTHVASGSAAQYMTYEYPVVLGSDLSGVVERIGPDVSGFAVGDRVFGLVRESVAHKGTFAELVAVSQDTLAPLPEGLDDLSAATLGLAAVSAIRCLDAVQLTAGDVLFVNGATGGVGSYVVQIASALGATVIASARPGDAVEHVRKLGAISTVDWTTGDMADAVRTQHPDGVTALIDLVNFDAPTFTRLATTVLKSGGRAASTLSAAADVIPGISTTNVLVTADRPVLARIAELVTTGAMTAPVTSVHDFDHLDATIDQLAHGAVGKIAVTMSAQV